MRPRTHSLALMILLVGAITVTAAEKSGVGPQAIVLPRGPGSVVGLGASYAWMPALNRGGVRYSIRLRVPAGPAGLSPSLALVYDSSAGDGPLGHGWRIELPRIQRRTDRGLPTYSDTSHPIPEAARAARTDRFITEGGEELVSLSCGDFFCENEGPFIRYRRIMDRGGWEASSPDGGKMLLGTDETCRIEEEGTTRTFAWLPRRFTDPHGNEIVYSWSRRNGSANLRQQYLQCVEYGAGSAPWKASYFVLLEYSSRPDPIEDGSPGFLVCSGSRLSSIVVGVQGTPPPEGSASGDLNGDGIADFLVRRYELAYTEAPSLLALVSEIGADGISSLPPYTFRYGSPQAGDLDASSAWIHSGGLPPIRVDADHVALTDLNADGLPDILQSGIGQGVAHRAFLNLGQRPTGAGQRAVRWDAALDVNGDRSARGIQLNGVDTYLADLDGDGRADLAYRSADGSHCFFPNRGKAEWGQRVRLVARDERPPVPFGPRQRAQAADMDGDRRIDLIEAIGAEHYRIWLRDRSAGFAAPTTVFCRRQLDLGSPDTHLADWNGDGLLDIVRVRPGSLNVLPSLGFGRFAEARTIPLGGVLSHEQVQASRLVDVDGDGLADVIIGPINGSLRVYINSGGDVLGPRRVVRGLPPKTGAHATYRWADLNGNGSTDLVRLDGEAAEPCVAVDIGELFGVVPRPSLLRSVDNGRGQVTSFHYSTSTAAMLADAEEDHPWPHTVPFPMVVLSAAETKVDLTSAVSRTEFRYHRGFYDFDDREFRGFEEVAVLECGDDTAPSLLTRYTFDVGRDHRSMRGKLLREVAEDAEGGVFSESVTKWTDPPDKLYRADDGRTVVFAHPQRERRTVHERGRGPAVTTEREFQFDRFGNPTLTFDRGNIKTDGDESITATEYAVSQAAWLVRSPSRREIKSSNGRVVRRSEFFYDDPAFSGQNLGRVGKGLLTLERQWLDPAQPDAFIAARRLAYDQYGNLRRALDPLATGVHPNHGHYREVVFDSFLASQPVEERFAVGDGRFLVFQADYDFRFGAVVRAVEPSGAVTRYHYDAFGRHTGVLRPDDRGGLPSICFAYGVGQQLQSGERLSWVETRLLDRPDEPAATPLDRYFVSRQYLDGAGRILQTRQEAEPDERGQPRSVVLGAVAFNRRGKATHFWPACFSARPPKALGQPLAFENLRDPNWRGLFHVHGTEQELSAAAAGPTLRTYDPLLREVELRHPDGNHRVNRYLPLVLELRDEKATAVGGPAPITHYFDGLGRLARVAETLRTPGADGKSAWSTEYEYDPAGGLVAIRFASGDQKVLARDGLGRITRVQDANYGARAFRYDAASNVVERIDAAKVSTTFTFDGLNRMLTEDWHDGNVAFAFDSSRPIGKGNRPDVAYFYDRHAPGRGRLAEVWDRSGEVEFSYDLRGRTANVRRTMRVSAANPRVFATGCEYDSLDRLRKVIYPDGDQAVYLYNQRNLLQSVRLASIGDLLVHAAYAPSEQRTEWRFGNGLLSQWAYDARSRLARTRTLDPRNSTVLHDLAYAYDAASNVASIRDGRPNVPSDRDHSQRFDYDGLSRLVGVQYRAQRMELRFDRLGNLRRLTSNVPAANLGDLEYGRACGPHAVSRIGNDPQRYDANGRLVQGGGLEYSWNAGGQMTSVRDGGGKLLSQLVYDYEGRRAWKDGPAGQTTLYASPYVEERPGEGQVKYVFCGAVRLARVSGKTPVAAFYHEDHLGSAALLTDGRGGLLVEQAYYPFGEPRLTHGTSTLDYGFVRTERDSESKVLAFQARPLAGLTGRFLAPDSALLIGAPLGSPQALNPYAYAANRPTTHHDPDGHFYSALITVGFAMYDFYQYQAGNITESEYYAAMALNGAALLADVSTGGMGGGLAVRLGAAVVKTARVIDRANTAYSVANTTYHVGRELAAGNYASAVATAGTAMITSGVTGPKSPGGVHSFHPSGRSSGVSPGRQLTTYYPPNRGFSGTPLSETLPPGHVIDRFGLDKGRFASPVGTPTPMRSLPHGTSDHTYSVFRVVKPIDVQSGKTAPWFGQPGGGQQYELPSSVESLLRSGHLERVTP